MNNSDKLYEDSDEQSSDSEFDAENQYLVTLKL